MARDLDTGYCFACDRRRPIERRGINHILHLLLSVFTAGIWLIVWLLTALVREPWRCQACGSKDVVRGERLTSAAVARVRENPDDDLADLARSVTLRHVVIAVGIGLIVVIVIAALAH